MKRKPRPKGLTKASIDYNNNKTKTNKKRIAKIIALDFINNEYMLNGEPINAHQLSEHYQISFTLLMESINKQLQEMGSFIDVNDLLGSHRSALGRIFLGAERDRALIMRQLQRLLAAQGDGYRPYVSAEVNNVLKLVLQSTRNFTDLTDRIIPKNPELVQILVAQNQGDNLSTQDAISLIRQELSQNAQLRTSSPENRQLSDGQKQLPLPSQNSIPFDPTIPEIHKLSQMPNVKANMADEGATINTKAKRIIEDPQQTPISHPDIPEPEWLSDYEDL